MPRRYSRHNAVRFNLDQGYIFLIFRYYGKRLKLSTGLKVGSKQWDSKRQRIKQTNSETIRQNAHLSRLEETVLLIFHETGGMIEPDKYRELIDRKLGYLPALEKITKPLDFIRSFNDRRERSADAKHGTTKNLLTYEANLIDFLEWSGLRLTWSRWDLDFLDRYKDWGYREKNWSINYMAKQLSVWRQWMKAAGDLCENDRTAFTVRKTATNKPVFYEDELKRIEAHKFTGRMELVRDMFLIGVWSLQRISDWKRISPERISEVMGVKVVNLWQAKTGQSVAVPLHPTLERLLEKYDFSLPLDTSGHFDQVFNRDIKQMAYEVGFTEKIPWIESKGGQAREILLPRYKAVTSHICRRSGATNLVLPPYNTPKSVIQLILGHSTISMTEAYINIGSRLSAQYLQINK